MSQEVIEITEKEIEVIEVVEKGPAGPVGPQANINYTVVTGTQTLSNSQNIAADTSGGSFTLTLPANPNAGDSIDIFDYSETFDTNPLTIARNGENIESIAEDLICNVEGAYFTMIYTGATRGWQILPRYGTTGGGGESVLTTQGDMVYRGAAINERLPIGTAGQILKVNSGGNAPEWGAAPATGVTSVGVTGSDGIEVDSGSPVTGSGTIALGVNAATLRSHINVADGANNYTHPNHTGEVTSSGDGATTIANDVVTNAKLANVATSTIKGRATAGTGDPEDLSASQVRTLLNVADGAEVNVQSNWTEADSGSDAFILNKPSTFTPTSHAASHATGGSDALAPSDIGAQSIFVTEALGTITANVTLTAARAKIYTVNTTTSGLRILLPTTGVMAGDVVIIEFLSNTGQTLTPMRGSISSGFFTDALRSVDRATFIAASSDGSSWYEDREISRFSAEAIFSGTVAIARLPVGTTSDKVAAGNHAHPASDITSGTITHERGGLEADVSAYDGLVKISGGATSAVTVTAAGEALLDDADAAAQRTTLGLGNSATLDTGTTAGTVAEGDHTHAQLHDRSHAITSTSDHTAGNHKVFYSNGSGEVVELALGDSGEVLTSNGATSAPSFAASGGIGGGTGSTDNAILRADGTGGTTAQASALLISDFSTSTQETVAISSYVDGFAVTADAATSVFTAVGHNFVANQQVAFTSLTGGSGVNTTRAYYVRDISGDTFKLSYARGTGALSISTDITAGTIVSAAAIVLNSLGFGGLITAIPDGTATNGNARGYGAVDLCNIRSSASRVASGVTSALLGGQENTASNNNSAVVGGTQNVATAAESAVIGGTSGNCSGTRSVILGGNGCSSSGTTAATLAGNFCVANAENSVAMGRSGRTDRYGVFAQGTFAFSGAGGNGVAQRVSGVLKATTTTDSAVEMFLDGSAQRFTIASGRVAAMLINITGVKSDGSAVAHYVRQYAIKNVAGTTSEVYAAVTVGTDNAAGTSINVSFTDSTVDALKLEVTGIASETWRWVASVDAVEVAYGS